MSDPRSRPGIRLADLPVEVRPCSLAAALDVLGERWSLLALREIGYGVHRFARIAGYTGASRDMLADRLRKLEAAGVIERRQYSEHPPRHVYHLTRMDSPRLTWPRLGVAGPGARSGFLIETIRRALLAPTGAFEA